MNRGNKDAITRDVEQRVDGRLAHEIALRIQGDSVQFVQVGRHPVQDRPRERLLCLDAARAQLLVDLVSLVLDGLEDLPFDALSILFWHVVERRTRQPDLLQGSRERHVLPVNPRKDVDQKVVFIRCHVLSVAQAFLSKQGGAIRLIKFACYGASAIEISVRTMEEAMRQLPDMPYWMRDYAGEPCVYALRDDGGHLVSLKGDSAGMDVVDCLLLPDIGANSIVIDDGVTFAYYDRKVGVKRGNNQCLIQ